MARPTARRSTRAFLIGASILGACVVASLRAQAPPQFRASVDVIPIEVTVVDRDGKPVTGLGADQFEVSLGGRKRRVVSATMISAGQPDGTSPSADVAAPPASGAPAGAPSQEPGRVFLLAVDNLTFTVGESRDVANAAQRFVARLEPNDRVGLFSYPVGPRVDPSSDHALVTRALEQVAGQRAGRAPDEFNLRGSEIVDLTGAARSGHVGASEEAIFESRCGKPVEIRCRERLLDDANAEALFYESQASTSVSTLQWLMRALGAVPGRKTVVLVSAGMLVSDRPGGRPDVTALGVAAVQAAAENHVSIYTLFIDSTLLGMNSAEQRKANRTQVNTGRESAMMERWLAEFAGSAGGLLIKDMIGSGDSAYDRILTETSAHYLLAIEPDDADRDGRPRQLRVNVATRGVTVRGHGWVVVPKR